MVRANGMANGHARPLAACKPILQNIRTSSKLRSSKEYFGELLFACGRTARWTFHCAQNLQPAGVASCVPTRSSPGVDSLRRLAHRTGFTMYTHGCTLRKGTRGQGCRFGRGDSCRRCHRRHSRRRCSGGHWHWRRSGDWHSRCGCIDLACPPCAAVCPHQPPWPRRLGLRVFICPWAPLTTLLLTVASTLTQCPTIRWCGACTDCCCDTSQQRMH